MSEKRFVLGEKSHDSFNVNYTVGDFVVFNELGKEKIGGNVKGNVMQMIKQLNGRQTSRIQTADGQMVEYQSNFFTKGLILGEKKKDKK